VREKLRRTAARGHSPLCTQLVVTTQTKRSLFFFLDQPNMTSPGSSRAAATTSAATLLGLLTITLAVLLGCLSPGVSACGGAPAAAEDALKKSTVPPNSTATNGRGGGAHATDAKPAPANGNPTSRWPDGMPDLWTGEHLPGSKRLEGMKCMVS
jgi:hypothetical protein